MRGLTWYVWQVLVCDELMVHGLLSSGAHGSVTNHPSTISIQESYRMWSRRAEPSQRTNQIQEINLISVLGDCCFSNYSPLPLSRVRQASRAGHSSSRVCSEGLGQPQSCSTIMPYRKPIRPILEMSCFCGINWWPCMFYWIGWAYG